MESYKRRNTWQIFKRNKLAFLGLIVVILISITTILGYLIMPDSTPMANTMSIQLSLQKPGTKFMMLLLPNEIPHKSAGILNKIFVGEPNNFKEVPITNFKIINKEVIVNEYIGAEDKPEMKTYNNKNVRVIEKTFWLGTDIYGRDLLSRLILGARVSLSVGLMAVIISMLLGISIGAIAGYYGGFIDACLSWLMNILWALPALLLVIALSFALGKGLWQIFFAVGLSMWVEVARLVRGQVISIKQAEFIEAARSFGFNNWRIISKHVLPNIIGPILVLASSNFAAAILLEAGLSFLGFGAQPPMPTWGGMIKEYYGYIVMDAAYLAIFPGLAIMILVYSFNLVTIGLRDAYDTKEQNINL